MVHVQAFSKCLDTQEFGSVYHCNNKTIFILPRASGLQVMHLRLQVLSQGVTGSTPSYDVSLLESRNDKRDHANLPSLSAQNACFILLD